MSKFTQLLIINKGDYTGEQPELHHDFKYPPDHFQLWGFDAINKGHNILVTAHTGSGKTYLAFQAIGKHLKKGKQIIYTAPTKALCNNKYQEFTSLFDDVGIVTGDKIDNPCAQLLIMTAECARNGLLRKENENIYEWNLNVSKIGCLIADEVHYVNDKDRGTVWEETIKELPPTVQLVMLSATITGAENFARWIGKIKNIPCHLIPTPKRPVPLEHNLFYTHISKNEKGKDIFTDKIVTIMKDNQWNEGEWTRVKTHSDKYFKMKKTKYNTPKIYDCIAKIKEKKELPVIVFVLNRKMVERIGEKMPFSFIEDNDNDIKKLAQIRKLWDKHLLKYKDIYKNSNQWVLVKKLIEKGIGIHHSGLIPILKEMVEILFAKKLLSVLIATSTVAEGLNFPTKSVIFPKLNKYDGERDRLLKPEEYVQMAGRAGRRGIDTIGKIFIIMDYNIPFEIDSKKMIKAPPQKVASKLKLDYNYILKRMVMRIENNNNEIPLLEYLENSINGSYFFEEENMYLNSLLTKNKTINIENYEGIEDYIENFSKWMSLKEYIESYSNSIIRLNPKTENKMLKKISKIKQKIPENKIQNLEKYYKDKKEIDELKTQIENKKSQFKYHIEILLSFLEKYELVKIKDKDWQLTTLGRIVAEVNECNSLLIGKIIKNGYLDNLEFPEIVALLSIFINDRSLEEPYFSDLNISNEFIDIMKKIKNDRDILQDDELKLNRKLDFMVESDWNLYLTLFKAVKLWAEGKQWHEVKSYYNTFEGNFIKNILRIANLLANVEIIANITNNMNLLNKLKGYKEKLIRDVVTVESLYL